MKSFKDYLIEKEALTEAKRIMGKTTANQAVTKDTMKWDHDGATSKSFNPGRIPANRLLAMKYLQKPELADKVSNIAKIGKEGGTLPTDNTSKNIIQSLYVLSNSSSTTEQRAFLKSTLGVESDVSKSPIISAGSKMIKNIALSSAETASEMKDAEGKEDIEVASSGADEDKEENVVIDKEESKIISDKEAEVKKTDETVKSDGKSVNLETSNARSPAAIAVKAKEIVDKTIEKLEKMKENLPTEKQDIIDNAILQFKNSTATEINAIKKQQEAFSINPTSASMLNATRKAENFFNIVDNLSTQAGINANKIYKLSVGQKLSKGVDELGADISRKANAVAKTGVGRLATKVLTAGGRLAKNTATAAGRAVDIAKESRTADALKTKIKEVDQKVADKILTSKQPIVPLAPEVQPKQPELEFDAAPMKAKIAGQESQTAVNAPKVATAANAVMDKATVAKILPGKRVMGKAKTKEDDGEDLLKTRSL